MKYPYEIHFEETEDRKEGVKKCLGVLGGKDTHLVKKKIIQTVYYQCPHCYLTGKLATDLEWFICGGRRCNRNLYVPHVKVSKEVYERIWGLSTL